MFGVGCTDLLLAFFFYPQNCPSISGSSLGLLRYNPRFEVAFEGLF